MPCRSDYPDDTLIRTRDELDRVTDMLCRTCNAINANLPLPSDVVRWWVDHQRADAARREREQKEAKYQKRLKAWEKTRPKR
jgi:hypothetical protein